MLTKETVEQLEAELSSDELIAILKDVTYTSHRIISSPRNSEGWPEFMINEVRALNQRIKQIKEK